MASPPSRGDLCAAGKPVAVGAELQSQLFVVDPQIPVRGRGSRASGMKALHFLRHDADIGLVAAEIAEAVVAETVGEMTEQDDVVLQCDVGAPSTAAATATAEPPPPPPPPRKPPPPPPQMPPRRRRADPCSPCSPGRGPIARRQPCPTTRSWPPPRAPLPPRLAALRAIAATLGAGLGASPPPRWRDRRRLGRSAVPGRLPHGRPHDRPAAVRRRDRRRDRRRRTLLSRPKHLLPVAAAEIHPVLRRRPSDCCCRSAAER